MSTSLKALHDEVEALRQRDRELDGELHALRTPSLSEAAHGSSAMPEWTCAAVDGEAVLTKAISEATKAVLKSVVLSKPAFKFVDQREAGHLRFDSTPEATRAGGADAWTMAGWLQSQNVAETLSATIMSRVDPKRSGDVRLELQFIRSLGALAADEGKAALHAVLQNGQVLEGLVDSMWTGIQKLMQAEAATAPELQRKFLQSGAGLMEYSSLTTFFGGLEAKVGRPSPDIENAMMEEHIHMKDSVREFTTDNYGIETTSATEWYFVADPDCPKSKRLGPRHGKDREPPFDWPDSWPAECRIKRAIQRRWEDSTTRILGRQPSQTNKLLESGARFRKPLPRAELEATLQSRNRDLQARGEPALMLTEAIGGRLYTGPLFMKYNAVLRGMDSRVEFLRREFKRLCRGNRYTTTLHVINSSLVKLSKLSVAVKVYRGISGRTLPSEFWSANEFGVKGGIESAFMSTTVDRTVALGYAAGGGAGVVFELQQGMIDRGADISFLSQYPHEQEVLFSPLTGLEVQSSRVEGSVIVVTVKPSVNLTARTIEQVVAQRRKLLEEMKDGMEGEVRAELASEQIGKLSSVARETLIDMCIGEFESDAAALMNKAPEWYNKNENFIEVPAGLLKAQSKALEESKHCLAGLPSMAILEKLANLENADSDSGASSSAASSSLAFGSGASSSSAAGSGALGKLSGYLIKSVAAQIHEGDPSRADRVMMLIARLGHAELGLIARQVDTLDATADLLFRLLGSQKLVMSHISMSAPMGKLNQLTCLNITGTLSKLTEPAQALHCSERSGIQLLVPITEVLRQASEAGKVGGALHQCMSRALARVRPPVKSETLKQLSALPVKDIVQEERETTVADLLTAGYSRDELEEQGFTEDEIGGRADVAMPTVESDDEGCSACDRRGSLSCGCDKYYWCHECGCCLQDCGN